MTEETAACPTCGAALGGFGTSAQPTKNFPESIGRPPSTDSLGHGRFLPGAVLAGRFRIVARLGSGGMGEVYRADDLKLGQQVALKLLPQALEKDPARLSRLLNEVRTARQISHPNVCRVYDAAEADGRHVITMEYVDGENLASLILRIGRLSHDKAVQLARQICAGLAAAHDQGVLHRDLKPANVMIDGRGRARITDFGLAILADEVTRKDVGAGTPAYMAPEQLTGTAVTVRSDVYALGLVLYEIFTGQPGFRASTLPELLRLKRESTPMTPSSVVGDLDPAVERVIQRCLAIDPRERPASALAVAASLPGGDPLAAALAAGETPSPRLVAEAGDVGGLSPAAAVACGVALMAGVALVVALSSRTQLTRIVPLPKPPEVLVERAQEIIRQIGGPESAADSAHGFTLNEPYLKHLTADASFRWERLGRTAPSAIYFWYRQSPRPLFAYSGQMVSLRDPPPLVPGMVGVILEPDGRLRELSVVPGDEKADRGPPADPDWTTFLRLAGFDIGTLRRVEPDDRPAPYGEARATWEGAYPGAPEETIRIEAAAHQGRPVGLRIDAPWTGESAAPTSAPTPGGRVVEGLIILTFVGVIGGSVVLARRNLRLGRGDRRGATRVSIFCFSALTLVIALKLHHASGIEEVVLLFNNLAYPAYIACLTWIFYVAIEPYLRRLWPRVLISWMRLLDGRWRDPLVGRDVVVGLLAAIALTLLKQSWPLLSRAAGLPAPEFLNPPYWLEFHSLTGFRFAAGNAAELSAAAFFFPMVLIVSLLVLQLVLRVPWVAMAAFVLLMSLVTSLTAPAPAYEFVFQLAAAILALTVFLRFGLLTGIVLEFYAGLLLMTPMTSDSGAWYASSTLLVLGIGAALAVYGLRVSLAGRKVLTDAVLGS
ncbi:MAG: serine/threonine protein kinase [Acidobacteria bacterium]|nr:serine/threonine protein kinase [Acidobacteriota bacterium]